MKNNWHSTGYTRDKAAQKEALEHYRFNLHRMADMAESVGAKILFIAPSDNLRDVTPFKSDFSRKLSIEKQREWKKLYDQARQAYIQTNNEVAMQSIVAAEKIDALPASLHFIKGRIFETNGNIDEALNAYERARDEDVCPLRALSPVQSILEEVTIDCEVPLVDFISLQSKLSKNGIPGSDVFLDHVHPTIESHRQLSIEILREMERQGWVNLHWDETVTDRITQSVMAGIDKEEHAVAMMNLAKVLGWAGKRQEAYYASKKSVELNPDLAEGQFQAGLAAFLAGMHEEAILHYTSALKLEPSHSDAHCNIGGLLEDLGGVQMAIDHFEQALQFGTLANRNRNQANLESAKQKLEQATSTLNVE